MKAMDVSDNELKAYLDGEMDAPAAERLEAMMEADPHLADRLAAFDPLAGPVRAAFEGVPGDSRLRALEASILSSQAAQPSTGWVKLAAVACLAAAIGFGASTLTRPTQDVTWQTRVAEYQALYVAQTVESIQPTPQALQAQFARAGAELGRAMEAENADGVPGLTLKRAQVLAFEGNPLIQIAYAADDGTPVAFCMIALEEGDADPTFAMLAGMATSQWVADGFGYMVIGDLPQDQITAAADHLRSVF